MVLLFRLKQSSLCLLEIASLAHIERSRCRVAKTAPLYRSQNTFAILDDNVKTKPLAQLGREKFHAVPPRFISKTCWTWIYLFRLLTGSAVHLTQWAGLRPAPTFGGHAHGWFSLVYYQRRFSADDLLSLADTFQLLVPVNAAYRLAKLYYALSGYQGRQPSTAECHQHAIAYGDQRGYPIRVCGQNSGELTYSFRRRIIVIPIQHLPVP